MNYRRADRNHKSISTGRGFGDRIIDELFSRVRPVEYIHYRPYIMVSQAFNLPGYPGVPIGVLAGFGIAGSSGKRGVPTRVYGIGLKHGVDGYHLLVRVQRRVEKLSHADALPA
ncbi:MAG: hypothetical protein LBD44_03095 [Spirochaetaceae bacterium]|nr:hypothetical protein [Spirochaetaceae bacterium]